jgi:CheY-like chemotaxis protein
MEKPGATAVPSHQVRAIDLLLRQRKIIMRGPDRQSYFVLVADDSADDRLFLQHALSRAERLETVAEVIDGAQAIAYLNGDGHYSDRRKHPLPHLLLLDLQMPVKDGFAVLEWLQERYIANLTVVVLTDSMRPEHIKRALDLGADLFQVKPRNGHDREALILALEQHLIGLSRQTPRTLGAFEV